MVKTTSTGVREARWAFLSALSIVKDDRAFLDRLRIIQSPWFRIYLHHSHRPDADLDLYPHDHPWTFGSLVLTGAYQEAVWPNKRDAQHSFKRSRRRFTWQVTHRGAAHMITSIQGPLWTLVITGRRREEWGFWVNGELVPWREYVKP